MEKILYNTSDKNVVQPSLTHAFVVSWDSESQTVCETGICFQYNLTLHFCASSRIRSNMTIQSGTTPGGFFDIQNSPMYPI